MRPLSKKLWRDAWHYRGQLTAIAAVASAGIALFVSLRSMHGYLRHMRDRYYEDSHFADVFANVSRAPLAAARAVATVSGVERVEPRVVFDVVLDVAGLEEGAIGRLVSIPVPRSPMFNALTLMAGRWPEPTRRDEVIASDAFARANSLAPGDSLGAVLNGRRRVLRIVGTAVSPEFVYEIGSASIFPDNRRFGVLWMAHGTLAAAFDMQGAFNDLLVGVASRVDVSSVVDAIDVQLERFGGRGAYPRAEQLSDQFLMGEIDETQVTSVFMPGVFLAVTAFLLHIVLSRLIGVQREEIATLRAFGYSRVSVSLHLIGLALIPIGISAALGGAIGVWVAGHIADIYARFFHFPAARFVPEWRVLGQGVVVAVVSGLAGAVSAAWHSATLAPAEAMRPIAPQRYRRSVLEFVRLRPSPQLAMIARSIERRPWRALLSILGLAMAGGLVVTSLGTFDTIDYMKELQFFRADRADATVTFARALRADVTLAELRRTPGVLHVEGFRALPVRLSSATQSYRTTVLAFEPGAQLRRVIDLAGEPHPLPPAGVLLSTPLADTLGIAAGGTLRLELLEHDRRVSTVAVAGVVDDLLGMSAYLALDNVSTIARGVPAVSGALIQVDPRLAPPIFVELKRLPEVAGVASRTATLRSFEETIAESFRISLVFTLGFACIIAFGIVYNSVRIALSERGRELASLRILGFTRREVSTMLLGEHALLTLVSIPAAMVIAEGLMWLIATRFESTLYRLPMLISNRSRVVGAALIWFALILSAWSIVRRIARLDLVEVLKTRE